MDGRHLDSAMPRYRGPFGNLQNEQESDVEKTGNSERRKSAIFIYTGKDLD